MTGDGRLLDERLERLAVLLDSLQASSSPAEHDHRGPDPCPVCGGRRPLRVGERPGRYLHAVA